MITKRHYAQRLRKLADTLQAATKAKKYTLCMDTWVGPTPEEPEPQKHCGTAGCAIGFCPVVFPTQFDYRRFGFSDVMTVVSQTGGRGYGAVAPFFGIDYDTALYLFAPSEYPGYADAAISDIPISSVVRRIRAVANRLEKK